MSDHHEECDGTPGGCKGWECGMCSCCGYDFGAPDALKDYKYQPLPKSECDEQTNRLCDLCAGTLTSNFNERASLHPEVYSMKTICYVGNAILQALDRRQPAREGE